MVSKPVNYNKLLSPIVSFPSAPLYIAQRPLSFTFAGPNAEFYKKITFTMSHFQGFFKWSVKNLITVPKTQETLREAQTNWEKGTEFKITLEKLRKMD